MHQRQFNEKQPQQRVENRLFTRPPGAPGRAFHHALFPYRAEVQGAEHSTPHLRARCGFAGDLFDHSDKKVSTLEG